MESICSFREVARNARIDETTSCGSRNASAENREQVSLFTGADHSQIAGSETLMNESIVSNPTIPPARTFSTKINRKT
jgi:oligoribonuclease NrnB/cAMP/cGMP phosphodiesterase (DHH superfamily)